MSTINELLLILSDPSQVRDIQNSLNFLVPPVADEPVKPDGFFGPRTGRLLGRAIAQNRLLPKHTINDAGVKLVAGFEGFKDTAYLCPGDVWTIGYGHTHNVKEGDTMSRETAWEVLKVDLRHAEGCVTRLVKVPIGPNMFSALVSWAFNVGEGNAEESTLMRLLNHRNFQAAADEFPKWKYAGGGILDGLVRRRQAERALFLKDL